MSAWNTPNNNSTLGPQYSPNGGGAKNGYNPSWRQSNPFKIGAF
jgi:hypothetical protein